MSRFIIPDSEVVVALDTGVVRNLCYETPTWVDVFEHMASTGYHFCLSEILLAEIVNQLERGSITSEQWKMCMRQVKRFVSPKLPCLPGKRQLFNMSGIREEDFRYDFDPDFEEKYSQAIWTYISSAEDALFLKDHAVVFKVRDQKYNCKLQFGGAYSALAKERSYWISFVKKFDHLPKDALPNHKTEILTKMKAAVDSWSEAAPPLSTRADLLVRYLFDIVATRTRSEQPYNPDAKDKLNDGIDFLLNLAFVLPALLCTTDRRFIAKIKALDSYQKGWVYTPEEIVNAWQDCRITTPSWPTDSV